MDAQHDQHEPARTSAPIMTVAEIERAVIEASSQRARARASAPPTRNPLVLCLHNPLESFPQWAEGLAREIAPVELATGIDCLPRQLGGNTYGIFGPCTGRAFGTENQRPAVVLDLEQLAADCGGLALSPTWLDNFCQYIENAVALFLHELAHVLSVEKEKMVALNVTEPAAREAVAACLRDPPDCEAAIPWQGHDARWIRTSCHLEARATRLLGFEVQSFCVAGEYYGLSPAAAYRQALADEPAQLAGEPFATIRQTRPPQALIDLWRADLQAWWGRISTPSKSQALAMEQGRTMFS